MKKKVLIFGKDCFIQNKFNVYEKLINIDEIYIKRIVLSNKNHTVIMVHINISLDIYIKAVPFHDHYAMHEIYTNDCMSSIFW